MENITINCVSFGHKYGFVEKADFVFDARSLKNPFYDPALTALTGKDKAVQDYVMSEQSGKEYLNNLIALLNTTLPLYRKNGWTTVNLAIGCTGGKHRSVTICILLSEYLKKVGYNVTVTHRDIEK